VTFDLESVLVFRPYTLCVKDIDSPRIKHCDSKHRTLSQTGAPDRTRT